MEISLRASNSLKDKFRQMRPLIIIGMHRSGTSLMVRLLKDLGIHMGRQLSRDAEAVYFQKINRRIYRSVGSQWGDVDALLVNMRSDRYIQAQTEKVLKTLFPGQGILEHKRGVSDNFERPVWEALVSGDPMWWGWKDPRTTLTFPIWVKVFPQARILHILRNGVDVAISIHRRSIRQKRKIWKRMFPIDYCPKTLDFDYCFELWEKHLSYVQEYKDMITPDHYLEIRYEDLLASPYQNLERIANFIEFPLQESQLDSVCQQIDTGRLINTNYARPYLDKIASHLNSQWMLEFNYSYQG